MYRTRIVYASALAVLLTASGALAEGAAKNNPGGTTSGQANQASNALPRCHDFSVPPCAGEATNVSAAPTPSAATHDGSRGTGKVSIQDVTVKHKDSEKATQK